MAPPTEYARVVPNEDDAVAEFFDGLRRRGDEPLLRKASGTVRFDLVENGRTDRRYLTVDRGTLSVSRRRSSADATIWADRSLFARMARGEVNPIAAVLRGELAIEGDWRLLVLVQRLFPSPPRAQGKAR